MTEDPRRHVDREGIHIERAVADAVGMEDELDSNVVGVYRFPDPRRRRIAGWVLVVSAVLVTLLVDDGWIPGLGFLLLGSWLFLAAWPLRVDEQSALTTAAAAVPFAVGHASAEVRFHGWRSRPRWSVVLYSATEPPDRRALVVVDAVSGELAGQPYVEDMR